ncbi:hypothetical protein SLEP1_g57489 [Rubroshorea leprosula]|uniref:Uncharacterized protein n=1 Tax=Rubroshorea leprosula TaxID=152421 RepID=A0AAV5MLU3_9ROSI|nr:hypothetical protein SLEP1_g57489 [Rubroshorea leprosula]
MAGKRSPTPRGSGSPSRMQMWEMQFSDVEVAAKVAAKVDSP